MQLLQDGAHKEVEDECVNDPLSLAAADALLSKVKPLLLQARDRKRALEHHAAKYGYDVARLSQDAAKEECDRIVAQLTEAIEQLEELGCYVKDLDIGLVDFLSTFEGRDVFLCWKLGEERIYHWHELYEGFSNRQEILDLEEWLNEQQ